MDNHGAMRALSRTDELGEVRRKFCTLWEFIGLDLETGGWRASRTISPGITHHIVTRTVSELGQKLAEAG